MYVTILDYKELKEVLKPKYQNLMEEEFIAIIPMSYNRETLQRFYEETGVTVFHYIIDEKNSRNVFFNRCGAYPEYDEGSDCFIQASGEYSDYYRDIGLKFDVCIEEYVQLMTQTVDLKHYVIVPKEVMMPDGDPRDPENEKFHKFYIAIERE